MPACCNWADTASGGRVLRGGQGCRRDGCPGLALLILACSSEHCCAPMAASASCWWPRPCSRWPIRCSSSRGCTATQGSACRAGTCYPCSCSRRCSPARSSPVTIGASADRSRLTVTLAVASVAVLQLVAWCLCASKSASTDGRSRSSVTRRGAAGGLDTVGGDRRARRDRADAYGATYLASRVVIAGCGARISWPAVSGHPGPRTPRWTRVSWPTTGVPRLRLRNPGAGELRRLGCAQVGEHGEHAAVIVVAGGQVELGEDVRDVLLDGAGGDDERRGRSRRSCGPRPSARAPRARAG